MHKIILLLLLQLSLISCVTNSKFAPTQLFTEEDTQSLIKTDLISLLDQSTKETGNSQNSLDQKLKQAANFDIKQRNRLQDRLILVSNQYCEDFKVALKKKHSQFNYWAGFISTVAGTLGGVENTKYLSSLSGISSGVRAEYNQNYFADLVTQVITKAINSRRTEVLRDIFVARDMDTTKYTIEAAIGDVINYHGACSLIAGLEQADGALSKANELANTQDKAQINSKVSNISTAASMLMDQDKFRKKLEEKIREELKEEKNEDKDKK